MTNSVWADPARLPTFPQLEGDARPEVLIVGGGLAGLLCAHALDRAGVDYLLIEADTICSGVSRNTTAKLTSQHGLIYDSLIRRFGLEYARQYWQANEAALARYRQLAASIDCDFTTQASYVYSFDRPDKLEKELRALERIGARGEYVTRLPLPFPVAGAIRMENQAQFHPLKFAAGLAQGLNIREHTAARAFAGNTVLTDCGKIEAKHIIIATHFPLINKHGGYFLKLYQHRSYVLALEHAPELEGMYVDEAADGLSFRRWGRLLLLGGGAHRTGKQGGNWAQLRAFATIHYPEAREVCHWATQDCMSLDAVPYIGPYGKKTPGLYVATGFHKWGMTSSMVAAMLLCDLVQGTQSPYAAVFSPARSVLRPQLLANLLQTTANLLTPTKPRCPHLGCALKWNPQEHSWDCPCHGSRFAQDGTLLDNPATGDCRPG